MEYKVVDLKSQNGKSAVNEILFEIATARAEGSSLLRISIEKGSTLPSIMRSTRARLKKMKTEGQIQLFATPEDFERMDREARFMLNKYERIISGEIYEITNKSYIYIKL